MEIRSSADGVFKVEVAILTLNNNNKCNSQCNFIIFCPYTNIVLLLALII
jgi:hypothetical protein